MSFAKNRTFYLIVVSFLIAFCARLFWAFVLSENPQFLWNNVAMINTNDGYYYAEGARDLIAGFHQSGDLSPIDAPLSKLSALLFVTTPFSLELLIFYMPIFFGSLITIPLYLIGVRFLTPIGSFFGAILGGIALSYYNRTMAGYFDTDMLVLVLPLFMLHFLFCYTELRSIKNLAFAGFFGLASTYWHGGLANIYALMAIFAFGYIVVFARRSAQWWQVLSLLLLLSAPSKPLIQTLLLIILLVFEIGNRCQKIVNDLDKFAPFIGLLVGIYLIFSGAIAPLWYQIEVYLFRPSGEGASVAQLQFYSVVQTIREASAIPFEQLARRISGHEVSFIFASIGYVWLCVKYPIFLLSLPLSALGFLAFKSGLRFTIFAVPFMALSLIFFFERIFMILPKNVKNPALVFVSILVLLPNILHIYNYRIPPVFRASEVRVLDELKRVAEREDYAIAWWDYGYGLRYYSDVKTLIDGAKHAGSINYPVSLALLSDSPILSVNLSRASVEMTERLPSSRADFVIEELMKHYSLSDPEELLSAFAHDSLPRFEKSREIYYYLPLRMLEILPTIELFSNINLHTGEPGERGFFLFTRSFRNGDNFLELGGDIRIDKLSGEIEIGSERAFLGQFIITEERGGEVQVQSLKLHKNAPLHAIYMKSQGAILLLEDRYLHSQFIRLFVFKDYDSELFEPIISTPHSKIYRLKR